MDIIKFEKIKIKSLLKNDFPILLEMEEKNYPKELIQGNAMILDIEKGRGLEYSVVAFGKRKGASKEEKVGYLIAVEDKTEEGRPSVYLEDVAVLSEARRQGIAWEMVKNLIEKLKNKSKKNNNEPALWNMHLRTASQGLLKKHEEELGAMGAKVIKEELLRSYYKNGEDALYRVYEIKNSL